MLKSFSNFFNLSKSNSNTKGIEDNLMLVSGILLEAAAVDGKIDNIEISKIEKSLVNFFELNEEKSNYIVNKCLKKVDDPNSLHYFTSKINKVFEYDKKINLLEILWEIILADGKIHDFESSLIRRLSGLLYISDIDCGNAKKRASTKTKLS